MKEIALCPNCLGSKFVSKPSGFTDDVITRFADTNTWSGDISLCTCPTCDGHGWVGVDFVPQEDFDDIKIVALSVMETAENLSDECTKRADRIKELETELKYMVAGEHAADKEIERLRAKIFDIEGREDLVTTELEHRADVAEKHRDNIANINMKNLAELGDLRIVIHELEADSTHFKDVIDRLIDEHDGRERKLFGIIDDLGSERERDGIDLELLVEMLKIVNPIIQDGEYIYLLAECHPLSREMWKLCQTVVQYRRKHNIVG